MTALLLRSQPPSAKQPFATMNSPTLTDLSSDLSSIGSLSPPPPFDYPSPQSSQETFSDHSESQRTCNKRSHQSTGQEPPKKRRKADPKPRTTQYLDIRSRPNLSSSDQTCQLDTLYKVLSKRKKIVVIAGAGISVSAGIPDFRSASGLFTTLKNEHNLKASGKHLFDASVYQTDSSTTSFHTMVRGLSQLASKAEPTAFHHMLATLGEQGRLMRLYTQNVDGIDTSLAPLATSVPLANKGPWPRTIQLHGGLEKMVCSKCNHLADFQPALFDGPVPPSCTHCFEADKVRTDHAGKRSHGIGRLRPRIVLYNEANPDDEAIGAVVGSDLRARPDAVIVVGTSMKIPGVRRIVREMCGVVRARRDGLAVWVNHDPPPVGKEFEDCWDLVVKGSSDDVAGFAKMRRWDDDGIDSMVCTELESEKAKKGKEVHIVIDTAQNITVTSMPTPAASPGPRPSQSQSKLSFSKLKSVEIPGRNPELSNSVLRCDNQAQAGSKAKTKTSAAKKTKIKPTTSDLSSNLKINMTYKVKKSINGSLQNEKTKASISSKEAVQTQRPMAPIPAFAAQNNGSVSTGSEHASLKIGRTISPQDLELLGPTKVVLASALLVSSEKQTNCEVVSPTGRVPTGMEMLLHRAEPLHAGGV
ncbi:MAG: hypothetical protein LQ337_002712 [Flavoplaca oasis]|nr:MAG: hypothetical protein LQ337_002712 [Flavoplaca oasis]